MDFPLPIPRAIEKVGTGMEEDEFSPRYKSHGHARLIERLRRGTTFHRRVTTPEPTVANGSFVLSR
jgi:hypothetical protein